MTGLDVNSKKNFCRSWKRNGCRPVIWLTGHSVGYFREAEVEIRVYRTRQDFARRSLTVLRLPLRARSHPSVRLYAWNNSETAELFFTEFIKL
jgi:hypothetical protein